MRKILSVLLAALMILSLGVGVVSASDREAILAAEETVKATEKQTYTTKEKFAYQLSEPFDSSPDTIEVWIKSNSKSSVGDVLSNLSYISSEAEQTLSLKVTVKGNISFKWRGEEASYRFANPSVADTEWHHVALVRDGEAGTFTLYIDGVLFETIEAVSSPIKCDIPLRIGVGMDIWKTVKDPFEGTVRQLTVYNGAISAERVLADMNNTEIKDSPDGATLLGNWYFGDEWTERNVEDTSGNDNTAKIVTYEKYVGVVDTGYYDYAIIGIPDIQHMVNRAIPKLNNMTQWIADNTEKQKFAFAFQVGDLSDFGERPEMYKTAADALSKLDGILPYSFSQGNHDYDDNFSVSRPSKSFNQFFKYSKFSKHENFGGSYDGKTLANTYWLYEPADDVKYLLINLEYRPRMEVLRWAGRLCEMYPQHRVIISTHQYIGHDGNTLLTGDSASSSSGKTMFENLVAKHSNIFMVFCGHVGNDDLIVNQSVGENGNTITEVHLDVQFSTYNGGSMSLDPFLIMRFNEEEKKVSFIYYSVEQDACWNIQNQFTISFADANNPTIGG